MWIVTGVMVVIAGVFGALAIIQVLSDPGEPTDTVSRLQSANVLADPIEAPRETAPDTTGTSVPLVRSVPGELSILYFGYTNCPDVCPLSMTALAAGMRELSPADRERIRVVFVTVDPARDTPEVLEPWLELQSPDYLGVVPPLEKSNAILKQMGYSEVTTEPMPDGDGYAVAHPGGIFVFTDDGRAHVIFGFKSTPDQIAHDLEVLLDGWKAK